MKLNTRSAIWIVAGTLFAVASVAIHYRVKVEMAHGWKALDDRLGEIEVGSEPPDFSAEDLDGRDVVLSSLWERSVVVLDFWATWCGPCITEMPKLEELHEEFKDQGVEILAINLGEGTEHIRRFLKRNQYTFRVVADQDESIGDTFGVSAIPTLVVVGMGGRVEKIQVGSSPGGRGALRELLERLTKTGNSEGQDAPEGP